MQVLENPIDEASANRSGISYVVSRTDWYWNLSSLLLEESHEEHTELRGELEKHIVSLYKSLLSYQMRTICSCYRHRLAAFLRDTIKLDDWEGAVKSIRDAEQVVQRDIDTYSTEHIKHSLRTTAERAKSQCTYLENLCKVLQDNTVKQEKWRQDDKDTKCLSDLRLTDPRDDKQRIEDTKGGLFLGASSWILDHEDYQRWRDHDNARLLWVKGDPGKGKTMLLVTIINELEQRYLERKTPHGAGDITALSYFFCQGTNEKLSNAAAVLRGLVYMLADKYPQLTRHLRESYDRSGPDLFKDGNAFFALSRILEKMLCDDSLRRVLIVVDALDECIVDRERLLKFIIDTATTRARWLVSSRNRDEIEQYLGTDCSDTKLGLEITQNAEQVSLAVNAYIDFKISKLKPLRDGKLRNQVRDVMRRKADGTFLWVALVVQELQAAKEWEMLQVMEEMPGNLEDLYDRIWEEIRKLRRNTPEFCRLILSAVTLAYRPLHLVELGVLSGLPLEISSNQRYILDVVASCGSFLTVKDHFIYVIHQSVKDYLSGKASRTIFPNGPHQVHRAFFSRSIQALSSGPLRRNIYNVPHPGLLIDDIARPDPDPLAAVRYSCIHWINHLCDGNAKGSDTKNQHDLDDNGIISRFLQQHFLHWLEASSLLRAMPDAVLSMTKLENLLRVSLLLLRCLE